MEKIEQRINSGFIERNVNDSDACYDLDPSQIRILTRKLLVERPPSYDTNFVCYRFTGDSAYANLGRSLEQQIFNEAFPSHPHTPEEMHKEYGPYESASIFLICFDTERQLPVGVVRVIYNSEAGLKSVNDLEQIDSSGKREWLLNVDEFMKEYGITSMDDLQDIGTLGVLREYRDSGMKISAQLYRGLYATIMDTELGATHGISIIDVKTLGQLRRFMGLPMQRIKGTTPFEYLGSQAEATYSRPEEYEMAVRRKLRTIKMARFALSKIPIKSFRDQANDANRLIGILKHFIDGDDGTPVRDGSLQFEINMRQ